MANWPSTLPQSFESDSFTYQQKDNVVRTKMDQGPEKLRPRSTAVPINIIGTMTLTRTQATTLKSFYDITTKYGTEAFNWTDPITEIGAQFRFKAPPIVSATSGVDVTVEIQVEELP